MFTAGAEGTAVTCVFLVPSLERARLGQSHVALMFQLLSYVTQTHIYLGQLSALLLPWNSWEVNSSVDYSVRVQKRPEHAQTAT